LIARGLVFVSRDPAMGHLVPAGVAAAARWSIEACSPRARALLDAMDHVWFRRFVGLVEQLTIPGLFLHYALRKLAIEELVRAALAEGIAQVVVLAAGFDSLALRLQAEFPGVRFIELDHPATQSVKEVVVREHRRPGANLILVPIDLAAGNLSECLSAEPGFTADLPTLFVAEGVLVYLRAAEVTALFEALRRSVTGRMSFMFTVMDRRPDGTIGFTASTWATDWWLKLKGEPFKWGLAPDRLGEFLSERGYRLLSSMTHTELRAKYLAKGCSPHVRLAAGETICLAEPGYSTSRPNQR
jgi:methyltransferase (TIGR00027 family)